jgi:hypothetical protein
LKRFQDKQEREDIRDGKWGIERRGDRSRRKERKTGKSKG